MQKWVILLALIVRIGIALGTTTFFQPDEYFQSLEVAHHLVFGYGHLTWEWLTEKPIRSIIYPALNVPIYWTLKHLHLDDTNLLIWAPRILHGTLAAATDIWLYQLTSRILGQRHAKVALFLSLTSFFHGLALSRSLSNSLETSLTTVALSYFPWGISSTSWRSDLRRGLLFAALACAVRPTNAILWVYLFGLLLWRLRFDKWRVASILVEVISVGSITVLMLFAADSLYYGKPTFTPLNFLSTNLTSVSLFYGSSPWHYYLSQGLLILCTFCLPFVLHGVWLASRRQATQEIKDILGLVAWTIGIYSLAGHKEWRFIHPLLPLIHMLAAISVVQLYDTGELKSGRPRDRRVFAVRRLDLSLLLLNIPLIFYVMRSHGRAQIEAIHYLRSLRDEDLNSVGFLMPCHSTPWQAYLHKPYLADVGRLWALGCEPPLRENLQFYQDQTNIFFESPISYLQQRFPSDVDPSFPLSPYPISAPGSLDDAGYSWSHAWPQNLVMFGALEEPEVISVLFDKGYRRIWHKHGSDSEVKRSGGVTIWKCCNGTGI